MVIFGEDRSVGGVDHVHESSPMFTVMRTVFSRK
jgi:hypothetical protein